MSESVKVICRVRPLNEQEKANKSEVVVSFPGDGNTTVSIGGKIFSFDHVVQPKASQLEVYEVVAKPIVVDVLNGYNGTIFAYGQTSSGKTFTMEGTLGDPDFEGVIPRIVRDIFNHINQMDENLEFHTKVSYFEIYMDKIRDLLDVSKTNLQVHEDKDRVPYVKGVTEKLVSTPEEVFKAIGEGKANRHVAVTNMNEHSSRSHSVLLINVRQKNLETQKKLRGKLYLVDLAGSEKVAKTGAEGTVLDEAKNTNKSLSALGKVINALVKGNPHVPYRDSKLTRILQESLGGNAKTTMVICCSPAGCNDTETKSTLMFGMRAKTIKNLVSVNVEITADEWRRRYEQEKEEYAKSRAIVSHQKSETERWRAACILGLAWARNVGDEQLQLLYQQLDDRDDEITKQVETIWRLQQQNEEQDMMNDSLGKEHKEDLKEITTLQSSKDTVKEVLQALGVLAINYDQKAEGIDAKTKELEEARAILLQQTRLMHSKDGELSQLEDTHQNQKKYTEMMASLLKDLIDVGECLNAQITKPSVGSERFDEEFTVVRLYISRMKSEAKSLHSRVRQLEEERVQHEQLVRKSEDESKDLQTRLHAFEVKVGTLSDKIDESESCKRQLQETVDSLNAELAKLRANEQFIAGSGQQNEQILADRSALRTKLGKNLKRKSEDFDAQMKFLRDELDAKKRKLEEYKDEINNFKIQSEKSQEEVKQLREELETKTKRLDTFERTAEKCEQAKQDLHGLEERVTEELETPNLRRSFIQYPNSQARKSANRLNAPTAAEKAAGNQQDGNMASQQQQQIFESILLDDEDDEPGHAGSLAQGETTSFPEEELDKLRKNNAMLRFELLKTKERLKYTQVREQCLWKLAEEEDWLHRKRDLERIK
ncbi:unnamed protein product [Trichobilharzia szidati]|nr:unnamed protein product [Trichobilharzia szidati]